MSEPTFELCKLECIVDGLKKPGRLGLAQLRSVTDEFSDARKIGHGGCGSVYKGILGNRTVAVKRLFNDQTIDDEMFKSEVRSMMMVNHKNIIQFLGFCSDTQQAVITMGDKLVFAEIRERLLCFEYIKSGSLKEHIKDELRGLNWHERYQIIEGICEGLHYLHKEMPSNIIHMDLKPENILLGENMVPKITDFGLARLTDKSKTTSEKRLLSLGYCAPEYLYDGKMSLKSDIYSLGVIIQELVTGSKVDPNPNIKEVLRRWRNRWNKSSRYAPFLWYQQVIKCLDLAQWCKRQNPTCRPFIWDIISELKGIDRWNGETKYATVSSLEELTSNLEDMLGIEPLDMIIPFALKEQIPSIKVTNDTNDHFAFRIATPSPLLFGIQPETRILPPRSQLCVTITLKAPDKALLQNHCYDFSVQSSRIDGIPTSMDVTGGMFDDKVGKVVDEVNVTVVFDMPPTSKQPQMDMDSMTSEQHQTDIESIKPQEAGEAHGDIHRRADKGSVWQGFSSGFFKRLARKSGFTGFSIFGEASYQGDQGSRLTTVPHDSRPSITLYTMREVKTITMNYEKSLRKGSFGEVYEGELRDKYQTRVAVIKSAGAVTEVEKFANEVEIQSKMIHRNVLRLNGLCVEKCLVLVYEYAAKGNLRERIHGKDGQKPPFPLEQRFDIAIGTAEGLAYMHTCAANPIRHGDVKPDNILLDEKFVPKLSDFGLSSLLAVDKPYVIGCIGYMDPSLSVTKRLTPSDDVYSFGVVLLELIARRPIGPREYYEECGLVTEFRRAYEEDSSTSEQGNDRYRLLDEDIATKEDIPVVEGIVRLAIECLGKNRPDMTEVARRLATLKKEWKHGMTSSQVTGTPNRISVPSSPSQGDKLPLLNP